MERRDSACKGNVWNRKRESRLSGKTYTEEEAAQIAARRGLPRFVKLALRQEGLSRKAKEEPKFKFYNLYSQVFLADTLRCAWEQARANKGAAGVDHVTFEDIERSEGGVDGFLASIQRELKAKTYRASPVKRVYIEKANGKLRPLGVPTVKDRVVQTAVKLVVEPIFEADFHDCSYGFRPCGENGLGRESRCRRVGQVLQMRIPVEDVRKGQLVCVPTDVHLAKRAEPTGLQAEICE